MRPTGAFDSLDAIADIAIRANDRVFRLGDIARVYRGYVDPPQQKMRWRGHEALGLGITMAQGGDVIQLGSFYLRYLNPRASAGADLERTMIIRGVRGLFEAETQRAGPAHERPVASARRTSVRFPKGRVRVIAGPRAGETIALDRVIATFGKPGEELAVITRRPQGYFVTHVEGRRVPRVNAQSIGVEARTLRHGDVIEVADQKLELLLD